MFQQIISKLREGFLVALAAADISKAYDCLNRKISTYKQFFDFGIRGRIMWKQAGALLEMAIKSMVNGTTTEEFVTNFGGPQGITQLIEFWRVLCNGMFPMLDEHLPEQLSALWGDDTTGVIAARTPQELEAKLKSFYDSIIEWCSQTRCHMNASKSKFMVFTTKKSQIEVAKNIKVDVNSNPLVCKNIEITNSTKVLGLT